MAILTKQQAACAAALNSAGIWPVDVYSSDKAWGTADEHGMCGHLMLLGAAELVRRWRATDPAAQQARQAAAVTATKRTVSAVAEALKPIIQNQRVADENAKVVELLDSWTVGGVKLGDCTKDKLMAEAGKLAHTAATARRHAGLYRKLAAVLKDGETVRKSSKRKALLAILQTVVS